MSLEPKIVSKKSKLKECSHCGGMRSTEEFISTRSWFYADGLSPVCNFCIKEKMIEVQWNWRAVDKLCQVLDIPFLPKEFERLHDINDDDVFPIYAKTYQDAPFEELGWGDYFEQFKELKKLKLIENELPELHQDNIKRLQRRWGVNYEEEALFYLEDLYNGMLNTQNINGALQDDQAKKLCKMSLVIDERIRGGMDFDKLMGSYDKMVRTAEFTPKNVKNENDFSSFSEVAVWLEKRQWINKYYDGVVRDVVDQVDANLKAFTQRLFINEPGLTDDVIAKLEALQVSKELENENKIFDIENLDMDLEGYDNEGYNELIKEEFIPDPFQEGDE